MPVLVKGVLTAEDAALAVEHGAAGVVVSNHGGRQLDCVAGHRRRAARGRRRGRRSRPRPRRRRGATRDRRCHRPRARRRRGTGRKAGTLGAGGRRRGRGAEGLAAACAPSWSSRSRSAAAIRRPRLTRTHVQAGTGCVRIFGLDDGHPAQELDGAANPPRRVAEPCPRRRRPLRRRLRQRRLEHLLRARRHRRLRPRSDAGRLRHLRPDLRRHSGHLRRGDGDVSRRRAAPPALPATPSTSWSASSRPGARCSTT